MQNNDIIRQINAYAMQNGIVLGLFGIATLTALKWSFTAPFFSTLFAVMLLGGPVLCMILTFKLRGVMVAPNEKFSFVRGFLHSLFCGFYASIWIALATFVYLQYFDHGMLFDAYARSADTPEMRLYLQQSGLDMQLRSMTGVGGPEGLAQAARSIGAATYAAMSLYSALIFGPVISAFIGLVCRRG